MKAEYEWVDFYTELANKILSFKNNRKELLSVVFSIFEHTNMNNYLKDGEEDLTDICPFTVMGTFNRGIKQSNRIAMLTEFANVFNINIPVPESFDGIPVLNNMKAWFFGGNNYDRNNHINKLWELFEVSIDLAGNTNKDTEYRFSQIFDFVLTQPCSSWNITFGLFWIRPYRYMTLDENTRTYLNNKLGMNFDFKKLPNGNHYLEICSEIKDKISSLKEIDSFPALSQVAWIEKEKDNTQYLKDDFVNWLKVQTKPDGEAYAEKTINSYIYALKTTCGKLADIALPHFDLFYQTEAEEFSKIMQVIKKSTDYEYVNENPGHGAFSAGMSLYEKFLYDRESKIPPQDISTVITKQMEIPFPLANRTQYWIYSPGPNASFWDEFYSKGIICIGWDEMDDLKHYQSREQIVNIMAEKYPDKSSFKNDSLALWDFASKMQIGDIIYAKLGRTLLIGRGIITSEYFYDDSRVEYKHVRKINWTHSGNWALDSQIAMKTLTDVTPYKNWCIEMEELICGKYTNNPIIYNKQNFLSKVYMNLEKYEDIITLLDRKKNIILQGAPGVGKSFLAKRLAYSFIGMKDENKVEMIQFHQNYSYEDFIEGFRPGESGKFDIKKGVFYNFCEKARNNNANKYVFIIDEINRGNLSKIMGELMLLLENDKRGEQFAMQLAYSRDRFYVPENIYIIGMMNTADRSLAMIDYALRRRFSFIPIEPAFDNEKFKADFRKRYSDADNVIEKMKHLNELITNELDKGHQIGHSYFCSDNDKSMDKKDIESIFKYEINELLNEYFFDDEEALEKALKITKV